MKQESIKKFLETVVEGDLVVYVLSGRGNYYIKRGKIERAVLGVFEHYEQEKNRIIIGTRVMLRRANPHKEISRLLGISGTYKLGYGTYVFREEEIIPVFKSLQGFQEYIPLIRKLKKPYCLDELLRLSERK